MVTWNKGRDLGSMLTGLTPLPAWSSARGDSGNIAAEQLTAITEGVFERSYPRHPLLDVVQFDVSAPAGAVATRYYEGQSLASWKAQGPKSSDMQPADLGKKAITIPVQHYFSGYEIWEQERKALAMLPNGDNAIPRLAEAILQSYRSLLVDHVLVGDLDSDIEGLLNTGRIPNTRRYKAADRLSASSTAVEMFELIRDLCFSIGDQSADIFGDEGGYVCALPSQLFRKISGTYFTDGGNMSVKMRLEESTGFTFIGINRLNSVSGTLLGESSSSNVACALVGKFDAASHSKQLPEPINFLTAHLDHLGLRSVTPAVCAIGGLHIYQPLSFATARNIWAAT
jgi:hypothetical protein